MVRILQGLVEHIAKLIVICNFCFCDAYIERLFLPCVAGATLVLDGVGRMYQFRLVI